MRKTKCKARWPASPTACLPAGERVHVGSDQVVLRKKYLDASVLPRANPNVIYSGTLAFKDDKQVIDGAWKFNVPGATATNQAFHFEFKHPSRRLPESGVVVFTSLCFKRLSCEVLFKRIMLLKSEVTFLVYNCCDLGRLPPTGRQASGPELSQLAPTHHVTPHLETINCKSHTRNLSLPSTRLCL